MITVTELENAVRRRINHRRSRPATAAHLVGQLNRLLSKSDIDLNRMAPGDIEAVAAHWAKVVSGR